VAESPIPAPRRAQITGLLLAGGRGQRLGGVDKGLVEFDGRPLALHVLARLAPQVAQVLISANRNQTRYAQWAAVVSDPAPASAGNRG
jgi:molybdenum cofactor guanylyltransferase